MYVSDLFFLVLLSVLSFVFSLRGLKKTQIDILDQLLKNFHNSKPAKCTKNNYREKRPTLSDNK